MPKKVALYSKKKHFNTQSVTTMFLQFRQLAKCVQRVRHSDPRDTAGGDRTGVARTITALH